MMIWRFTNIGVVRFEVSVYIFCGRLYYLICYGISGREDWEPEAVEPYYKGSDREEDNTGYEYYLVYHQWNAFQGWLANHSEACESFSQFEVSAMIHRNQICFFCNLTHSLVWEKDCLSSARSSWKGSRDFSYVG